MIRAENVTSCAYGDPERWGASVTVSVPFNGADARDAASPVTSPQIVRAQVPQLMAVPWFCTAVAATGAPLSKSDKLDFLVRFDLGVGQTTTSVYWKGSQGAGADGIVVVDPFAGVAGGLDGGGVNPAFHLAAPICASAIAASVVAVGTTEGSDVVYRDVVFTLQLAPMPGLR